MSKSKKNVVAPEDIFEAYGVDAARLFVMSDSPPERDVQWTASGVEGAWPLRQPRLGRVRRPAGRRIRHDIATRRPWPCASRPTADRR
jgi:leucyl-tRNA synthetase